MRSDRRSELRHEEIVNLEDFLTWKHVMEAWELIDELGLNILPTYTRLDCSNFEWEMIWGKNKHGKESYVCMGKFRDKKGVK